jgi:K+-sensing histidine kinase KdpD
MAVMCAAEIADSSCARLHVLMVASLPTAGLDVAIADDIVEACMDVATDQLATLGSQLTLKSVQYSLRIGAPAQEIARYALEYDIRQIVLGRSRPTLPRIMSTAWRVERLLAGTDCEVMIVTAQMPGARATMGNTPGARSKRMG